MSIPLEAANSGSLSHTIADRSLLLRCEWKLGIPLEVNQGTRLSSRDDLGYMEIFQFVAVTSGFL